MLYLVGKTDINRCFPHSTKEKCFDVIHFKNVVLKDNGRKKVKTDTNKVKTDHK